jgi:peptidoglycan/LPS O-acetylase OafA/YrhL
VKYGYLTVFFALLSGLFYPFIQGGTLDYTIYGVIILFVGLAGGIMIYKASTSDKKRGIYLGIGLGLVAVSLLFVLELTGRPLF